MFKHRETDEIIRKAVEKRYNLAIEWSMREPKEPLKTMIDMKQKGYDILKHIVIYKRKKEKRGRKYRCF